MSDSVDQLLAAVPALPERERAEIAARLIDSLEGNAPTDSTWSAEWEQEIQRRLDALDQGRLRAVPWAEARRRVADAEAGGE